MRRVVVTGVGMVTPCGATTELSWEAIVAGRSGIGPITRFDASEHPSQIAGECRDFDPLAYIENKRLREGARFIHLALGATEQALRASGFEPNDEQKERVGVFFGVGLCGLELIEEQHSRLLEKGPRKISPYFIPATISNLAPGQISMRYGFKGANYTTTSACSSGAHAIGEAVRAIRYGHLDAAVAGGSEACITPLGIAGFTAMRALSKRNDEPARASRPFDKGRDGFVMAEGAASVIVEERGAAIARGAPILAEVLGYGATSDAFHLTQPAPEGEGAQRAMRLALEDGRIAIERVGYVNAHATSTPTGDLQEIQALKRVLGDRPPAWITATKSVTGHLLGAAGGLEAALTVLSVQTGVVPPTINLEEPEDELSGLDVVAGTAREGRFEVAISNSFGFGGTNVTLAFGPA
ncbi:MAG: beta-ketoacyl-ACP synthase II [Sandaracinaceae bacterium]|nr:beta-ketoacyl-ACP synthase II [Sandaracinaceae bacterium]